jgi:hypothetical protein
MRNRAAVAIVLTATFAGGCASSGEPVTQRPTVVARTYDFSGVVMGEHLTRSGIRRIPEHINGTVTVYEDGTASLESTYGSCSRGRASSGSLSVSCPWVSVSITGAGGRVRIPVRESREYRGECAEYAVTSTGGRGPCLRWEWRTDFTTRMRSGTISVSAAWR